MEKRTETTFTNDFSEEVFNMTYAYEDETINDRFLKTAVTVASLEKDKEYWSDEFYKILTGFTFVPGGRILSNAGIPVKGTTFLNCFASGMDGEDQDSMEGILRALRKQALILKSEGGYGACMDVLRPKGGYITGIANESPGVVKMMELWDKQSEVITEGSGRKSDIKGSKKKIRKGAQLLGLSVWHKDIEEFITAKQTPGRLTKCNMSVLITDKFIDAVKNHKSWDLIFPDYDNKETCEYIETNYPGLTVKDIYKKEWDGNIEKWISKGLPISILKTISDANELWDLIMKSTYNRNEPGVLFVDKINRLNNLYYTEYITTTNPCGEIPLPIGGSCLLGSLNLTQLIDVENNNWDYKKLKNVIEVAVRFLDNVNDLTYVPLEEQRVVLQNKRRIGLGLMGYGSALLMLKKKYGGTEANKLTEELIDFIANTSYQTSSKIAKEKGSFPEYDEVKYLAGNRIALLSAETRKMIKENGMRNSHLTMSAPTGNTGVLANNISGGIEPVFSFMYRRTFIIPYPPEGLFVPKSIDWNNKTYTPCDTKWEWIKEGDEDQLTVSTNDITYKIDKNRGLLKETSVIDYGVKYLMDRGEWNDKADWASDTNSLSVEEHLEPLDIITRQICSSVSKTINIPNDYPYEKFKEVYLKAYDTPAIKGVTTYRAGTMGTVLKSENETKKVLVDLATRNGHIIRHAAPIRPKVVPCEVCQMTSMGVKWTVFVGMVIDQDDKLSPYEIFAFKKKNISLSSKITSGKLTKVKSGIYNFESADGLILEDLASLFDVDEQEALTRMISTSLRHGVEIKFIVEQLNKAEGTIVSFSKAIARALKKHIPNNEKPTGDSDCPNCGAKNSFIYMEGCIKCKDCGVSKC